MKIEKTYEFVKKAHSEQVDKNGVPYINHLVSVYVIAATKYNLSEPYLHAALLHDLIEDTEYTLGDLDRMGYEHTTIAAVDKLTVRAPFTAMDNIKSIISTGQPDINVIMLKMADNEHNRALHRIEGQPFGLIKRYVESWHLLNNELQRRRFAHDE